ncbi:MAG: WXG100 family type VII secretion target [Propionibacteriaceae bacterium]|jgi:WXG100 family type VII secretion target|nr:WXG100 family type VII secretion target [Propionibacteriaceae bacterium]
MAEQLKVGQEVEVITGLVTDAKPELDSIITNGISQATQQAKSSWEGAAADALTNKLLPGWEQKAKGVVRVLDDLVDSLKQADQRFVQQNADSATDLTNKFAALGL